MRSTLKSQRKHDAHLAEGARFCGVAAAVIGSAVVGAAASSSSSNKASEASQNAIDANKWQGQLANEQWNRYKQTYAPLEEGMVAESQNYDTPEAQARAAGAANTAVQSQFSRARSQLNRQGLDPSSPGYQANLAALDMSQAATGAQAQNAARTNVRDMAWARKMDALGLGKGLVTNASNAMANAGSNAAGLSNMMYGRAQGQASNAGALTSGVINGIQQFSSPGLSNVDPTYGNGFGGRSTDFSENMQQYGM